MPARGTAAPLGCLSNPGYGGRTRAAMALAAARRQLRELADALAFSRGQAIHIGLTSAGIRDPPQGIRET